MTVVIPAQVLQTIFSRRSLVTELRATHNIQHKHTQIHKRPLHLASVVAPNLARPVLV